MVEPTLTAGSFDISNAIVDGAYERALSKLRDLLAMQQDPLLLLGGISRQMRQLQYARVLLGKREGQRRPGPHVRHGRVSGAADHGCRPEAFGPVLHQGRPALPGSRPAG